MRERALRDGRSFLAAYPDGAVIDEVQRAPELLSYLQTVSDADADADGRLGRYILTGSQSLLLSAAVSQGLAGRAGFLELLPLSWHELPAAQRQPLTLDDWLLRGGYPALWQRPVAQADWMASYLVSYVERDVRQISRVADLLQFQRFVRTMAARCGQLLNLNAVANDLGVAQTTARDWLAVLEASYIAFRLPPHHSNFGKRMVKTPPMPAWMATARWRRTWETMGSAWNWPCARDSSTRCARPTSTSSAWCPWRSVCRSVIARRPSWRGWTPASTRPR